MRGARNEEEASRLQAALCAVAWVEATWTIYARAGRLGFELRRRGVTVPVTDCIIAAAAETIGGRMLTLDGHFEDLARVAGLSVLAG